MPVLPEQLFVPETAAEIRDMMLTDHKLEARKYSVAEPAVFPGTDDWLFYSAVANGTFIQYGNIALIRDGLNPETSQGDDLKSWQKALKIPDVPPSGSAGAITITCTGTGTIPAGTQMTLPNGRRLEAVSTQVGVSDNQDIDIRAIDTGEDTNAEAGTIVRFVNTPFVGLQVEAKVSINAPLTGGYDRETEARLRLRIENKLAAGPGGGNWGQAREIAFNTLASVNGAWPFPALGGPASWKLVIAKGFDRKRNDYSRRMATGALQRVRNAIHLEMPDMIENVVATVENQSAPLAFKIKIPNSVLAGGDGRGWRDASPWPTNQGNKTTITAITSDTQLTVDFGGGAPTNGQTRIAWWSPRDMRFRVFTVLANGGSAGARTLTVDSPMVDSTGTRAQVGEYISPAAVNIEAYGDAIIDMFESLACGENTDDVNRLPRAARRPFTADAAPEDINGFLIQDTFKLKLFTEVTNLGVTYLPTSAPTVPVSVDDSPNILVPSHVGIYPY